MRIEVSATIDEREPINRPCSLQGECLIEPGAVRDYMQLAAFHYRNSACPPAVHQVYRARHKPSGRTIGAIVYAAPALNLGIRNAIFGERYKIGGRSLTNTPASERLNREMELIIRVVVHPTFRGAGLGRLLIAETLALRPYRYVEMSAAMGEVNPFAEKAGMRGIRVPARENTVRAVAALKAIGMTGPQMSNPAEIVRVIDGLEEKSRKQVTAEIMRYAERWIKSRTGRVVVVDLATAARRIAENATSASWYYLWENPKWKDDGR